MTASEDADLVFSLLDTLADLRPDRGAFRKTTTRLRPEAALARHWAERTGASGRMKVGLAWRSMLLTASRNRHYLKVKDLHPLRDLDADFWLLQPNASVEEIAHLRSFLTLHVPDNLDLIDDLEGQLALTSNLDFLISPFTTTGEMAGALGVPTFLISTTASTQWRRNPDGSDIWHQATQIVWGDPVHDRRSAVRAVADALTTRRGLSSQSRISVG